MVFIEVEEYLCPERDQLLIKDAISGLCVEL